MDINVIKLWFQTCYIFYISTKFTLRDKSSNDKYLLNNFYTFVIKGFLITAILCELICINFNCLLLYDLFTDINELL